jgi:hypothetical protein
MKASEYICRGTSVFVECAEVALPIWTVNHAAILLDGRNGVGPLALKLDVTGSANECGGIATARKPMLLLPARETGSPECDILDNGVRNCGRNRITSNPSRIGELGIVLLVG